jgi:GDP-L-fucose synthase
MMHKSDLIYVAGHKGLVGSAVMRELERQGYRKIITRTHAELNLVDQAAVTRFFAQEKPAGVILCAAKVGGIGANAAYPADFIYQNLMIAANVIHAAYESGVKKLLNLGSSCIYPKMSPQPMKEEYLLTGPLEVTNEAYAVAKIAAIRMCKHYNDQYGTNFLSAMPTNMYGPGDNYDLANSHVLPAMIHKFHMAKTGQLSVDGTIGPDRVTLWGNGSAYREFLYSDDLARAVVFLLAEKNYQDVGELINIGSQSEVSIGELAEIVREVVYADVASQGRRCQIDWDTSRPNGTPRKLMDSSRLMSLGWKPQVSLPEGISLAYQDFLQRNGH